MAYKGGQLQVLQQIIVLGKIIPRKCEGTQLIPSLKERFKNDVFDCSRFILVNILSGLFDISNLSF